ncbi:hypothetical protein MHU86_717 [Fragilaria crotonensis]|nr:hypothetical protein MHU86_717 [Fragilaria crotonensis]
MFARSSPKGVEEFGHAMDDIRLDNFHDDMLPSPEELKTLGLAPPTTLSRKRWFRLMCAGLVCATVACVLLIASRSMKKHGNEVNAENSSQSGDPKISSRIYDTIDFLLKSVDHDHLTNSLSPEFLAARWIADKDGLAMPFSPSFLERYALATLWFATDGDNWWNNDLFMTDAHHCEWYSIFETVDKTDFVGVRCNEDHEVTSLVLQTMNLKGSIPEDLSLLSKLERLMLDKNNLTDIENIRSISTVSTLSMGYNQFSGTLPTWLGGFSNLRALELSNNGFKSTIPTEFRKLKSLVTLSLGANKVVGNLQVLEGMSSLENIYLQDNLLTGTVDSEFLKNLERIQVLDLSNNDLTGILDRPLLRRSQLEILDLSGNRLKGSLPDFPHASFLKFLNLRSNSFEGSLPPSISRLSLLEHLDVSDNKLSGTIPSKDLNVMTSLQYLSLASNRNFTPGALPDVRNLSKLKALIMKESARTGAIPSWISDLHQLVMLDLEDNHLNSTIPWQLGSISDLAVLLLNRNDLTGTVPVELRNLRDLNVLILDQNKLTGDVDRLFCSMDLPMLIADCAKVRCECCTMCCSADEPCLDRTRLAELAPMWDIWYLRDKYPLVDAAMSVPMN